MPRASGPVWNNEFARESRDLSVLHGKDGVDEDDIMATFGTRTLLSEVLAFSQVQPRTSRRADKTRSHQSENFSLCPFGEFFRELHTPYTSTLLDHGPVNPYICIPVRICISAFTAIHTRTARKSCIRLAPGSSPPAPQFSHCEFSQRTIQDLLPPLPLLQPTTSPQDSLSLQ